MPRDIAQLCHGQRCYLMFPIEASHDPAMVVPCHLRLGGVAGMSQKPPPVCCLPGCFDCHNLLDGRAPLPKNFTREQMLASTLVGFNQWLAHLWTQEILIGVMP